MTNTSSEFFNRKLFILLDSARTLETKYKLLDPASIANDALYTFYGTYAICSAIQEEHGRLISDSDWPALAKKLPESNSAKTPIPNDKSDPIQYYKFKEFGHKANDPICPLYETRQKKPSSLSPKIKVKDSWKYIEPKDLSKPVTIDGKDWYFLHPL